MAFVNISFAFPEKRIPCTWTKATSESEFNTSSNVAMMLSLALKSLSARENDLDALGELETWLFESVEDLKFAG